MLIEIEVDAFLADALAKEGVRTGVSPEEVAIRLVRRHLAVRTFNELREQMISFAEAQGIFTDEDVFRELQRASA